MKTIIYLTAAIVVLALLTPLAHAEDGHPAWNTQISGSSRFNVLKQFNEEAVFDRETGLVWMRSPGSAPLPWYSYEYGCNTTTIGNRKGWRLPTIQELASLVDPTQFSPALPAGHPFNNVESNGESSVYWSATTFADDVYPTPVAWVVRFSDGNVGTDLKSSYRFGWCVRGGQGVDPQ